jgi:hypothetical protein
LKADLRLFRYLYEESSAAPHTKVEPWKAAPEWKFVRQDVTFGSALWLVCCSVVEDLKRDLQELRRDQRGKIQPLPEIAPPRQLGYAVGGMPDAFFPGNK